MDLAWWQILIGAVVGLVILIILVIIHELGHAIVAIRNGVEVEEFGVGFPPRAKLFGRVGKTLVTLNWLPLGGFCKMKGESDDDRRHGTYGAASLSAKAKILLAGVFANFLTACVLFTILAFIGIPKVADNQFVLRWNDQAIDNHGKAGVVEIANVVKGSVAEQIGLQKGDKIVKMADVNIDVASSVTAITTRFAGRDINVDVIGKDGQTKWYTVSIPKDIDPKIGGRLGIQAAQIETGTIKATWSAPIVGIATAGQFFWMTLQGIGSMLVNLFSGVVGLFIGSPQAKSELASAGSSLAGPIGILGNIFPGAVFAGPDVLLYISALISISLAVMNLLPIPGLDGGRLYVTLWYHARKKRLTKEREEQIVGRGMLFIFGLIIVITLIDVIKMFMGR